MFYPSPGIIAVLDMFAALVSLAIPGRDMWFPHSLPRDLLFGVIFHNKSCMKVGVVWCPRGDTVCAGVLLAWGCFFFRGPLRQKEAKGRTPFEVCLLLGLPPPNWWFPLACPFDPPKKGSPRQQAARSAKTPPATSAQVDNLPSRKDYCAVMSTETDAERIAAAWVG